MHGCAVFAAVNVMMLQPCGFDWLGIHPDFRRWAACWSCEGKSQAAHANDIIEQPPKVDAAIVTASATCVQSEVSARGVGGGRLMKGEMTALSMALGGSVVIVIGRGVPGW